MASAESNNDSATPHAAALFKKYAAVSTTAGSFDEIGDYNAQMDITEFTRFAKDFGITEVLTIAKLKIIFQNSNLGDSADDRRGYLNQEEFAGAVVTVLQRAKAEFECRGKQVNNGVKALEAELHPKSSTPRSPKKSPKQKAQPSAEIVVAPELPLDLVPESNFQSDGVKVPVSKLWGAIREVEDYQHTEKQLYATIDKLNLQYKEQLEKVEKQKSMAVAALERSENEFLEYQKGALEEVNRLSAEADAALTEKDQAEQECEAMRAERQETFRAMKELKRDCEVKCKQARDNEEEMAKLLHGGNLERDEAYEDGRRMAQQKAEQQKRQDESEASLKAELAALQQRMDQKVAELLREREEAEAAAKEKLKQVRAESRQALDDQESSHSQHVDELQTSHEAAMAAQKSDYEAQLLAAQDRYKALTDKLNETCLEHERQFAKHDEEHKAAALKTEVELGNLRNELATTAADLQRTRDAKTEAEERLQSEIDRLYEQLKEERERREAVALKLAEVEQEALEKRQQMQQEIDDSVKKTIALEEKLTEATSKISALSTELEGAQNELTQANAKIADLESLGTQLQESLEESKQREQVLQDRLDAKEREMEESVASWDSVVREREQTIAQLKADLDNAEDENSMLRQSLAKVREELNTEQQNHADAVSQLETTCDQLKSEMMLLKTQHEAALASAQTEHEQALASAQAEHEQALASAQTEHEQTLASAQTEHEQALASARADADSELAAAQQQHKDEVSGLKEQQQNFEDKTAQLLKVTTADVHRLCGQTREMRAQRDEALSKNNSYEKSIQQLDAHISEQQLRIEQLKAKIAAADEERRKLLDAMQDADDSSHALRRLHEAALEQCEADHAQEIRELQNKHQQEKDDLTGQISHLQGELSVLQALHKSANVSIDELEKHLAQMREDLRNEEKEHNETQNLLELANTELKDALSKLSQLELEVDEQRIRGEKQAAQILQLETERHTLELAKEGLVAEVGQLKAEAAQLKAEMERLTGEINDTNERHRVLSMQKELVDKQLKDKIVAVDALTVEVRTLEETNAEIAAETQKAITSMTEEMEQMRQQFQSKLSKMEMDLRKMQMERDELASAYQFAKDELQVIRTTLNSMEEGSKTVRYITEQSGNPTLVNRMNSEWGRVSGMAPEPTSPRRSGTTAFSRDFRQAQRKSPTPKRSGLSDAPKQGDLGDHWRF